MGRWVSGLMAGTAAFFTVRTACYASNRMTSRCSLRVSAEEGKHPMRHISRIAFSASPRRIRSLSSPMQTCTAFLMASSNLVSFIIVCLFLWRRQWPPAGDILQKAIITRPPFLPNCIVKPNCNTIWITAHLYTPVVRWLFGGGSPWWFFYDWLSYGYGAGVGDFFKDVRSMAGIASVGVVFVCTIIADFPFDNSFKSICVDQPYHYFSPSQNRI